MRLELVKFRSSSLLTAITVAFKQQKLKCQKDLERQLCQLGDVEFPVSTIAEE